MLKFCRELELICPRSEKKFELHSSNSEKVTAFAVRWSATHGEGWSPCFFEDPFIIFQYKKTLKKKAFSLCPKKVNESMLMKIVLEVKFGNT